MSTDRATTPIRRPAHLALAFLILCTLAIQAFGARPVFAQATQISVTANDSSVALGGSTTVTATVRDATNNPVAGVGVNFLRTPTALGTLSPATGTTNVSGQVSITFTASAVNSGNATIRAGIVGSSPTISNSVVVRVRPAFEADDIALSSNKTTIVGDGVDSTDINGLVTLSTVPVTNNTVSFFPSFGTVTPTSMASDSNGIVTTTLRADQAGTVSLIGNTQGGQATNSINITVLPSAITTTVSAVPSTLNADGTSTATISATLTQTNGDPFPVGDVVTFTTDLGSFANGSQTFTTTTDVQGQAVAAVRSVFGGIATVTATPAYGVSGDTTVTFEALPLAIKAVALPGSILADDVAMAVISATATISGTPAAGETINFTTTAGTLSSATATTDANGVATVTIRSATVGTAMVSANYSTVTDTIQVAFTPVAATVTLSATPNEIRGNGFDSSALRATVRSAENLLVAGTTVSFTTDFGTLSAPTATTNAEGVTTVTLVGSTLQQRNVTVVATINNGANADTIVSIIPSITPDPPVIVVPAEGEFVNVGRPDVSGTSTAPDGSLVTVFLGDSLTAIVCADVPVTSGAWSCTSALDLPEGDTTLRARVTDTEGNPPSSRSVRTFTIDTIFPAAPVIDTPADGATTSPNPTISGTAVDEDGGDVKVDLGPTTLCVTPIVAGAWSCVATFSFPNGPHTITALTIDQAGNRSPETTRDFIVDGSAVAAPGFNPPLTVMTGTPVISGTADSDVTITLTIILQDASSLVYVATSDASGNWGVDLATATPASGTLPIGGLPEGTYPMTAQARNGVGTLSAVTTATLTVDLTPDPVAPESPVIVTPAELAFVNTATPVITGTSDAGVGSLVEVFLGEGTTTALCTALVDADGNWTCTPATNLPEGLVTIRARVTDTNPNNPSSSRSTRNFTVDTTAPVAPVITSPEEAATTGPRPTISGTAMGEAGSTVTVTSADATICTAIVAADDTWSCSLVADLPVGANTIAATVTDQAGNTSPVSLPRAFTVVAGFVDAPSFTSSLNVDVGLPTIGGVANSGTTVTLTITLLDNTTVVYTAITSAEGAWSVDLATATPVSGTLPAGGLITGSYPLAAQAANSIGVTSEVTTAVLRVTIPVPPPVTAPAFTSSLSVEIGLPTIGGTADAGTTVTLTITLLDNTTVVYTAIASAEGAWSVDLATATPVSGTLPAGGLITGSYPLAAQAANSIGATSEVTTVVLRVTIPVVLDQMIYLPFVAWLSND